jgi:hypothetical protein
MLEKANQCQETRPFLTPTQPRQAETDHSNQQSDHSQKKSTMPNRIQQIARLDQRSEQKSRSDTRGEF